MMMNGILGSSRGRGLFPSQDDEMLPGVTPPAPTQQGLLGAGATDGGEPGLSRSQRNRLLFAGLADAIASLQGRDSNVSAITSAGFDRDNERQRRLDVNKHIQAAYATGNMDAVRQALMGADPADVAHITQAMSFGQPKYQEAGGGLYQLDPFGGDAPKQVIAPAASNTPHDGINPTTGKAGQYLLNNGAPQWLDVGVPAKAPTTREVRMGRNQVTQEFDPLSGGWKEVGRGPAFKPEAALAPPDPKAVDLGVQYFIANGGKFPPTARSPALQNAIMAAANDRMAVSGQTMDDLVQKHQTLAAGAKAVDRFGTGKQGDTVRSLNVSVQHLDTLRELGVALKNGDVNLINAARQKFSEAFGGAAPTNWDAAKAIVADEVAKGVIGGQTAQSDRETLAATLKNSRSPEQVEGAIGTFQDLLGGQLRGLRQEYKSTTHRDDFNSKLFPETVRRLDPPKKVAPAGLPPLPRITAPQQKIRVFNPATGRLE